jgi:hypothetical protein
MSPLRLIIALPFALTALAAGTQTRVGTVPVATVIKGHSLRSSGLDRAPRGVSSARTTRGRAWSYDWPVKPFNRPHAVRGYFNDPRITPDRSHRSFHFGIDIALPFNTPVFAIRAGRVHLRNRFAVAITSGNKRLEYWHIVPVVREGQWVPRHALLGKTKGIFNHVHLSEYVGRHVVNPLRPGGIGPFLDDTAPTTDGLSFRVGSRIVRGAVHGRVNIVADSYDTVAGIKPEPWPVTPALLRWRILEDGQVVVRWQVAHDFRWQVLPPSAFNRFYASGTRMNHPGRPGHYCFYLAHRWSSASLPNGQYVLEVAASDVRGDSGLSTFDFTIAN